MRISFVFPTGTVVTGGNEVLYRFANGLSDRGHQVNFLHAPLVPARVNSVDELPEVCLGHGVRHYIADSLEAPELPDADVVFNQDSPARLGRPATFIQGYRMLHKDLERRSFVGPGIKFAVARWLIEVAEELGAPVGSVGYVPPGLDHDAFKVKQSLANRPIDVTFMCNMHREKGWPVAAEAIERLLDARENARIVVFSRTEPRPLPDGVEFRSSVSRAELIDSIYNRTRVYVQTSRHEGFGLPPVEAMACGAALVTTDCGGSREYAVDGETALVVPVDDAKAVAGAVGGLLDDEVIRQRLAAAGNRYVRRFDWDESVDRLERGLAAHVDSPGE